MTTWILVSDASQAKLFTTELPEQPWSIVAEFTHPAAHKTSKDLSPTEPGKSQQSGSAKSRHTALEPSITPKEAETLHFIQELRDYLESATAARKYDRLLLVAPPRFLGLLHEKLDKQTAHRLVGTVDKDLVMLENREIRERLVPLAFAQPD
jgi:protein required for attachment to host cells